MLLLKPYVVGQDELPIYSLDLDPTGAKLVTAGCAQAGTGWVKVWNLNAIFDDAATPSSRPCLPSSQFEAHLHSINCIRWANTASVFATGGADFLVKIWFQHDSGQSASTSKETWKCTATLSGHSSDVMDLDWSPGDRCLVSCSLDNTIIVWNALKFPDKIVVLTKHESLVKGVKFDPMGKFLASQSTDKTMKIWCTSDWSLVRSINSPFAETSDCTHVMRLDWSPDGMYIASANAMNNGGPVSKLIERQSWSHDRDFVGHQKAITCVRWNPMLYRVNDGSQSQPSSNVTSLCAVGSKDHSVSLWSISRSRPLCIIKNVFTNSITDIAWSRDGSTLVVSSLDGNIICCRMDKDEFGAMLSGDEKADLLKRIYGSFCMADRPVVEQTSTELVADSAEFAVAQRSLEANQPRTTSEQFSLVAQQQKTLKRRITEFKKRPAVCPKPGQRRVATIPLDDDDEDVSTTPSTKAAAHSQEASKATSDVREAGQSALTPLQLKPTLVSFDQPVSKAASVAKETEPPAKKRKKKPKESVSAKQPHIVASSDDEEEQGSQPSKVVAVAPAATKSSVSRKPKPPPNASTTQLVVLPALVSLDEVVDFQMNDQKYSVKLDHSLKVNRFGCLAQLHCRGAAGSRWKSILRKSAVSIKVTDSLIVVVFDDNIVGVYSVDDGSLTSPLFSIQCQPSRVVCQDGHLLILFVDGSLQLWNLKPQLTTVCRTSVAHLLSDRAKGILAVSLSANAAPVLTLSDYKVFTFSIAADTWLLIADPLGAIHTLSVIQDAFGVSSKSLSETPLKSLTVDVQESYPPSALPDNDILNLITDAYMETQMQSCQILNSKLEFKLWLMRYVTHLVNTAHSLKLRRVLNIVANDESGTLMGWSKKDLFKEMLPLLGGNKKCQKIFAEFSALLEKRDSEEDFVRQIADSIGDLSR